MAKQALTLLPALTMRENSDVPSSEQGSQLIPVATPVAMWKLADPDDMEFGLIRSRI
jgi:hypothetical protein